MKIEVLEDSKIKVTLTIEDLIYYNLKPEKLSAESPKLHKFLFNIMENVRRETGFNPYKGTVAIEAVHSKEGMVLYISGFKNNEPKSKNVTVRGERKTVRAYCKNNICHENSYYFDDFSNLCTAIVHINIKSLEVSSLYEYKNKWYFILGANDCFEHSHCVLTEHCAGYGSMIVSENFLREHGKTIAKGRSLIALADGLKKMEK